MTYGNTREVINSLPREVAVGLLDEYGFVVRSRFDDQEVRDQLREAFESGEICVANIRHAAGV